MVVVRSLRKGRYIVAFFLTSAIFIIGILLGSLISEYRSSAISDLSKAQRLDYDSLQLQYLQIGVFLQQKDCAAAAKALDKNLNALEMTRLKLEGYMSTPVSGTKDFDILKREYLLAEIRYWFLLKQTENVCKRDAVSLLYFYSTSNCQDCSTQGTILTYLKDKLGDKLLVFSLDSGFSQEPMIDILKNAYDIKSTPSMIIQNQKYDGLHTKEELLSIICKNYESLPDVCKS